MTSPLQERLGQEVDAVRLIEIIEQELCPPEPQLLDICVVQNLDWVDHRIDSYGPIMWEDGPVAGLMDRYGPELANDLIDLGLLYRRFEERGGYPWLVSRGVREEARFADGAKGKWLSSLLECFRGHQDDWSDDTYSGVAKGLFSGRRSVAVSPLLLRGLEVTSVEQIHSASGPLSSLPDAGDRMVAAEALIVNVPVLLTTDRRTFWRHRVELDALGLAVMRPTELLKLYEPYWEVLDGEFMQRSDEFGCSDCESMALVKGKSLWL